MKKLFLVVTLMTVLAGLSVVTMPVQGLASVEDKGTAVLRGFDLDAGDCNCDEERTELMVLRDRIADAPSVEASRALALEQTDLARKALSRAKWVIPFNGALGQASEKLDAYEVRVKGAGSQEEVATAFGDLVRLASADELQVTDAGFFDKPGCEYTTGEIVVIVIGFLLAIIPGFIFMAIFC